MRCWSHLVRKYPLSCLAGLLIWVVCLIPIPETPLNSIRLIDKWTHLVMYGGLCAVIWGEYLHHHATINRRRLAIYAFLAPICMGGLVEIAQATCTNGVRSGDWVDFAANTVGVIVGQVIGILLAAYSAIGKRGNGAN